MDNVIQFHIRSIRPLLMQAETLANPLNSVTKTHKSVSGKRKKSEDDYNWRLESEWKASMYHDKALGPYMPSLNIEACISEAAKAFKQGKAVKQTVEVMGDKMPLQYSGPRDMAGLYGDGSSPFVDVRGVNVGGRKVMRARPVFMNWELTFDVGFMADLIDSNDVIRIVEHAGRVIGIGTYRPRFGRFEVVKAAA